MSKIRRKRKPNRSSITNLKNIDIVLLIGFPVLAALVSLSLKASFLLSTVLFYGLSSCWLSIRTPHKIVKTLLFALVTTIPFGIFADYLAYFSHAWFVPQTVFSFRLFGTIPVEDLLWGFLVVYNTILYYEHYFDKGKVELIDKRMKYLILLLVLLLLILIIALGTYPQVLAIHYMYFWFGVIFILLPTFTFLSFFPRLLAKYVKTASYFFVVAMLFELTGLQLHQWEFIGNNFIGWVELFGYRFPFEEFFFFFIMVYLAILSWYEFFDDDRR